MTQVPSPSHWVPPVEHGLPAPVGLLVGTPLSQMSSVHGFWSSTGTHSVPPVPLLLVTLLLSPPVPLLLVTLLPVPLLLAAALLSPPPLVAGPAPLLQPHAATTLTTSHNPQPTPNGVPILPRSLAADAASTMQTTIPLNHRPTSG
jgi:hypothetical protein